MTYSEPRLEVIGAIFDALSTMDPAKAERVAQIAQETGITAAERQRADELFASSLLAGWDHRQRVMAAWEVLIERPWPPDPTWEHIFDQLTPDQVARLRDLYDAMPDGARAEFDRRYGQPGDDD